MTYRLAIEADRPALVALLTQVHLHTDDLPAELGTFLLAVGEDGQLVGAAGIMLVNDEQESVGLLRSVAVQPAQRGQYIGQTLVDGLLHAARHNGLTHLYLLTTTADAYFERLGFDRISRDHVPDVIRQTRQFSSLCPNSAVAMQYVL